MREAQQRVRKALIARRDAIDALIDASGMILVNADITLDQARRLAFAYQFDGRTFEDQADALGCDRTAREIARKLEGMNLMHAVQVIENVRLRCWQRRYQGARRPRAGAVH